MSVTSFNTRTGAVTPASGDYTFSQIKGPLVVPGHAVSDSIYTVAATDALVYPTTLTAARVWTLPAASEGAVTIYFADPAQLVTSSNTITAAPNGTDKINGVNSSAVALNLAGQVATFISDGTANWTMTVAGTEAGEVTSFNTRTGAVVPTSGDYTVAQVTGALSAATAASTYLPIASPAPTGTIALTGGTTTVTTAANTVNDTTAASMAALHTAITTMQGYSLLKTAQANTSVTVPTDARFVSWRVIGGGGGGAAGFGGATGGGGGGGGCGMVSIGWASLVSLGSPATLFATVGAAGTAGTGASGVGGAGGNGGQSLIGLTTGPANIFVNTAAGGGGTAGTSIAAGSGGSSQGTAVCFTGYCWPNTGGGGGGLAANGAAGSASGDVANANNNMGGSGGGGGAVSAGTFFSGGAGGCMNQLAGAGTGGNNTGGATGTAGGGGTNNATAFSQNFTPQGAGGGGGGAGSTTGGLGGAAALYGGGAGGGGAGTTTGGSGGLGGVGVVEIVFY